MYSMLTDESKQNRSILVNVLNTRRKRCLCCFKRRVPTFKGNQVTTSKYNILTFLPMNLMLQFSKMANLYFLILLIMELDKSISDSNGKPVLIVPLSFVVGLSMIKDMYEDFLRHRSDNDENNRRCLVMRTLRKG